jgi:nitrate reductase gamma subunit
MNTSMDLLLLARGPLFEVAVAIFIFGVILRLTEVLMLGRRPNYAEPRGNEMAAGMRTVFTRMLPDREKLQRAPAVTILGYLFHLGFFVTLLLFAPHIELLHNTLGLYWPALPNYVVDAAAVVTLFALVGLFINRLVHPVLKMLSTFEDFFLLVLCFLVVLTGYLAYHRLVEPYPAALAWHILSVELLLVIFPFTKLMHAFTLFLARWYNGAIAGRKGVES